ncbi:MAG: deoxyribodipyrimidine photo-lyase [Rhabdochlamydiaceae bacterium]|nr:deoxyribodipyrimidine photo-lyase [Candidatus Amphrikana amoebophyrae]
MSYVIHWFRQDLRLKDNPALHDACKSGYPVLLLYTHDENSPYKNGDAHNVWLHHSLLSLKESLDAKNFKLLIMKGSSTEVFKKILSYGKPQSVYYNECYDSYTRDADQRVSYLLEENNIHCHRYHGNVFIDPDHILEDNGSYYTDFLAYWNALNKQCNPKPICSFPKAKPHPYSIPCLDIEDLALLTSYHWKEYFSKYWKAGEASAIKRVREFYKYNAKHYPKDKVYPGTDCSSKLSCHLHFGEVSPWQILEEGNKWIEKSKEKNASKAVECFIKDIATREYSQYMLYHRPEMETSPIRDELNNFPWAENQHYFNAWKQGMTGYPIVDAAMRQLMSMGWCHSRARIIAATFLLQDLKIHWQEGQKWYLKNLFDADIASNAYNWQLMAWNESTTLPYYCAFSPEKESKHHDPKCEYIKRWIPELKNLPVKYMHAPWKAPKEVLKKAGVILDQTYPLPIIDHNVVAKETLKLLHQKTQIKKESVNARELAD